MTSITITSVLGEHVITDEQIAAVATDLGYKEIIDVLNDITVGNETRKIRARERNPMGKDEFVTRVLLERVLVPLLKIELKADEDIAETNKREHLKDALDRALQKPEFSILRTQTQDGER